MSAFPAVPAGGKAIDTVRTDAAMLRSWRTIGVRTAVTIARAPGAGFAPPAGVHAGNEVLIARVAGGAFAVHEATTTGPGNEALTARVDGVAF
jgi:hypothetical protein